MDGRRVARMDEQLIAAAAERAGDRLQGGDGNANLIVQHAVDCRLGNAGRLRQLTLGGQVAVVLHPRFEVMRRQLADIGRGDLLLGDGNSR